MIVDCHVHTWRYPEHFVKKDVMLRSQPARRKNWSDEQFKQMFDIPIENYLKAAEGVIDKAILVGFAAPDTAGVLVPNDYVREVANQHPDKLEWCCCVIPTEEGAVEEVERCVKLGAIALGELAPVLGGYYANDKRCYPVWERCQNLGVPVIIHAGLTQLTPARMKYADLNAIDDIAIDFPDLKLVICHMGYPQYETGSFLIQKHANVYGGIEWLASLSGLDRQALSKYNPQVDYAYYFHLIYPLIYHLSQTFGEPDKLIFGTDWTESSPRRSIEIFEHINDLTKKLNLPAIPDQIIHNLLHENWKKVFKLTER
ncbi:MAG TPA: amidohydrolase family protein [Dehalococcoidia bacterium]|nr:amidohydrolase family protein [Dehalococcoidia bacterium]